MIAKVQWNMQAFKKDFDRFSHLYIVVQVLGGGMQNIFSHKNQPAPPTISDRGNLQFATNKSNLVTECHEGLVTVTQYQPDIDCIVCDGASAVHTLKAGDASTFQEYTNQLNTVFRNPTGKGRRQRVTANVPLPKMSEFLKVGQNKSDLFHYLSH